MPGKPGGAQSRRSAPLGHLPQEPTFPLLLGGFLGGLSPCSCLHKACKFRRWQRRVDVLERALVLDLSCSEDEPAHGRAIERGGKADPANSCRLQFRDRERL